MSQGSEALPPSTAQTVDTDETEDTPAEIYEKQYNKQQFVIKTFLDWPKSCICMCIRCFVPFLPCLTTKKQVVFSSYWHFSTTCPHHIRPLFRNAVVFAANSFFPPSPPLRSPPFYDSWTSLYATTKKKPEYGEREATLLFIGINFFWSAPSLSAHVLPICMQKKERTPLTLIWQIDS